MPEDEVAVGDGNLDRAGRMALEEIFLGLRVEVSGRTVPPLTREGEIRPCSFSDWSRYLGDCGASSGALRAAYDYCLREVWPHETVEGDNVTQELLKLVKAGDEAGFRALAGCVMPAEQVHDCWDGVRARLGLGDG